MKHVKDRLSAFLDNELKEIDRLEIERHLGDCSECRDAFEDLREASSLLRALPRQPLPAGFMARLKARRLREEAEPDAPGESASWLPLRGLAFALSSLIVMFVAYEGIRDRLKPGESASQIQAMMSGAASSAPNTFPDGADDARPPASTASSLDAAARQDAPPAPPKAAMAKAGKSRSESLQGMAAGKAPGVPYGEKPEAPPALTNEALHAAQEAEKRALGIVKILPRRKVSAPLPAPAYEGLSMIEGGGSAAFMVANRPEPAFLDGTRPELLAKTAGLGGGFQAAGAGRTMALRGAAPAQNAESSAGAVIRSQGDLLALWNRLGRKDETPIVNFNQEMLVLVLALGQTPAEIVAINRSDDRLVIFYRAAAASAKPYPFRAIPAGNVPVEFKKVD